MVDNERAGAQIALPEIPENLRGAGKLAVWREQVTIPTYEPGEPDMYPQYLDQRVYQGSSGRVYPMPFFESIATEPVDKAWNAVHMANDFVRLMVLPDLGGRIYYAEDLTKGGYDFFYKNNVVKPALVGVLGPWISGGVEFNWPQHHRPATYLPDESFIEYEDDGAITVWCSDLDPFERLKGMHGIRMRPDSSVIEVRARLHNRTDDVQTFLWWANVAAPVGDHYQSFFPTDVHVVADHAKRAMTGFPHATDTYYGIDYPERVTPENPDGDRIDWYKNIPVPTSYMCIGTEDDFFGGYDHGKGAGFVHIADHHIAPGKKQWTWGNERFGWAWDRNLTDTEGPYVELMAGVYTDNQPDFSFLQPGETKTFSQFWYPIQDIGCATQANTDVAVRFEMGEDGAEVAVAATRAIDATISVREAGADAPIFSQQAQLAPGHPFVTTVAEASGRELHSLTLSIEEDGAEILTWTPRPPFDPESFEMPQPAFESPAPADIDSVDELFLAGFHLQQYRHATRRPEMYWEEALRRDPGEYRTNVAMARLKLRRGLLDEAEGFARTAIKRLTWRNPNPYDSEAYYVLGLVLGAKREYKESYDAFAKAAWTDQWKSASHTAMARMDLAAGRNGTALELLERTLVMGTDNLEVRSLLAIALHRAGRTEDAVEVLEGSRDIDNLDPWTRFASEGTLVGDAQVAIDVALELASAGEWDRALQALELGDELCASLPSGESNPAPLIAYHRWDLLTRKGDQTGADAALADASGRDRTYCFPGRLADAIVLERAAATGDAVASALLGHWLYANKRPDEAIVAWENGPQDDPVVLRNLGVGAVNVSGDYGLAVECYERAMELRGYDDERLLFERDQLAARMGEPIADRLARLERYADMVARRSDLSATFAELLALSGRADEAEQLMLGRTFQPWEGGEGMVLEAWEVVKKAKARAALAAGRPSDAVAQVNEALMPPQNLGEDRHYLANSSDLDVLLGDALSSAGDEAGAREAWERAAKAGGDFVGMAPTAFSLKTFYTAQALSRLGRVDEARTLLEDLRKHAQTKRGETATIDYFATSLPTMLLFHEDIQETNTHVSDLMEAQALVGLGDIDHARPLLERVLQRDPAGIRAIEIA